MSERLSIQFNTHLTSSSSTTVLLDFPKLVSHKQISFHHLVHIFSNFVKPKTYRVYP